MARLDVRTQNPERYAQVKAEQEELKIQFSMAAFGTSVARLCPYCEHIGGRICWMFFFKGKTVRA